MVEYLDKPLQTDRVVELVTELLGKEDKVEVEDESKTEPGGTFIDGILTSSSFNIADVELPVDSDTEHEADEVEQQAKPIFDDVTETSPYRAHWKITPLRKSWANFGMSVPAGHSC